MKASCTPPGATSRRAARMTCTVQLGPKDASERVEEVRPLLSGEIEIEVAKRADAARCERDMPWHALHEARVNEHVPILDLTE